MKDIEEIVAEDEARQIEGFRKSKDLYYLEQARITAAVYDGCPRRRFGAVVVSFGEGGRGEIIGTGTNKPADLDLCHKSCLRNEYNIPPRLNYEMCRTMHAEQMALFHAGFFGNTSKVFRSTMYLVLVDDDWNVIPNNVGVYTCMPCAITMQRWGVWYVVEYMKGNVARIVGIDDAVREAEEFTIKQLHDRDFSRVGYGR